MKTQFTFVTISTIFIITAASSQDTGFCTKSGETCSNENIESNHKYLIYDVNPPEGFNLRRDVYMRFAIMLAEAQKRGQKLDWKLVLPPWYSLYHWQEKTPPLPWSHFFDVSSMNSYAPIIELNKLLTRKLEIDVVYVLNNYADAFEGGSFIEKWDLSGPCDYKKFWGYTNIIAKEVICVRFQGKASKLWELVSLHPRATKIMFAYGEIALHGNYGTKSYWDCRKSMKFHPPLVQEAREYIKDFLDCMEEKCDTYVSVHWRRQDFARSRRSYIPTIQGAVKQIDKAMKQNTPDINKLFIATDATEREIEVLDTNLLHWGYDVFFYNPDERLHDGQVAIIEQIICSHAAYFIGTHESTFTYRIQEEREILGFDSDTTFNRLCPDTGYCEKPSKWTIVN